MNKHTHGFASMNKEQRNAYAVMGGKAAQASGKGRRFTSEEARVAGRKGGVAVSQNKEHMASIGRKGGAAARDKKRAMTQT
jgi:general stress protein YciG